MAFASYYKINGFVDTSKTIGENLDKIAQAAAAFITFNVQTGQFAILFEDWRRNEAVAGNQFFTLRTAPDTVIASHFDDDNILGTMIVTEMPDDEIYNAGEIKFNSPSNPGKFDVLEYDLKEWSTPNTWNSQFEYSSGYDLFNFDINDPLKKLSITNEFINNDSQASIVLRQLLHSSRQDQLIEFETDFSMLGITPGDNCIIRNANIGFEEGNPARGIPARVVQVTETDDEAGNIILKILAQPVKYDMYETAFGGFEKRTITRAAGIPPIRANDSVQASNDEKSALDFQRGVNQNDTIIKSVLASINVPIVGGGAFEVSAAEINQNGPDGDSTVYNFYIGTGAIEHLTWHIHNPYDDTNNEYFPYTLELRRNPDITVVGGVITAHNGDGTLYETYENTGTTPTIVLQQQGVPSTDTWQFRFVWTNGTPPLSDIDANRYRDTNTSTYYAMRIAGTFLIT